MRTVKKSDIIFDLNPRRVYIENFTCRFYTVNEADYSIGYSSEDVVTTIDGENVKYTLNLDWKQLRNVGRGMLVFKCLNNIPDTHFPDGEFNSEYVEQTDYFIDTFEVEPEEEESFNERIEAVESGLSVESETRATDDAYISGAVDTLDAKVEEYKTATDTAIASEESARTEADNAISAATDAAIASEASARTAADDALSTAIANEASARTEADSAISAATDAAIASEASARTAADDALSTAINNEASARTAADEALSTAINNEASARTAADNALSTAIDNEASARTAADEALSTAIDNETSARTDADNAISAVVDTKASIAYVEDVERTIARSLTDLNDVLADVEDVVDTKADVSAFTAHTASTVHMDGTEKTNLDSLATNIATISGITSGDVAQWNKEFDDAKYEMSGTTHVINFYHDNVIKATIVADDFIKDGMVSNVVVSGGNLVISFNTDAGQEPISIPLTDIFDPANYYTKTDTDTLLADKADKSAAVGSYQFGAADGVKKITFKRVNDTDLNAIYYPTINGKGIITNNLTWAKDNYDFQLVETSAFTAHANDGVIHVTSQDREKWDAVSGKANSADVYTTGQTYTKTEVDTALSAKADTATTYTKTEVDAAISGKADSSAVTSEISAAVSGKANSADVYTTGNTYSKTEVDTALSAKADTATTYTKTEVDAAISGKADTSAVTEEITAAVSGKADTSAVTEAITAAVSGKQDTLVSGTNIKTINNESILGSGNITISGGGDLSNYYTKSETDAALSGKVSVDYVEDVERVIARSLTDLADSVDDMETSISGKQDTLVSGTNIKTINNQSILGEGNITIEGGGSGTIDPTLDSGSTNAVANSAITAAINAVSGAVSGKQDTLVSGTNIKTINGSSVLGSGDLTVSNTVSLTQAQYDALTTIDPNTLYIISDATEIDITDYYTKSETDAIVSGKQDTLVSGTNIKTINNESILGSGNITIEGGGSGTIDPTLDSGSTNAVANSAITTAINAVSGAVSGKANSADVYTTGNTYSKTEVDSALSGKANSSDVYTTGNTYSKTEVDTALSGKQDTLVSGTSIKTINNQSILGEGNITIEGGGGSGTYSAGTNISIDTGNTISCTIPAYFNQTAGKGDIAIGKDIDGVNSDYYRLVIGQRIRSRGNSSFEGSIGIGVATGNSNEYNQLYGSNSIGIGRKFNIGNDSLYANQIYKAIAIGYKATVRNNSGVAIGADTEVSGTTKTNINNQLTIDTSNQVYVYNKENTEMICLQDYLGGGSITIDPTLDSGSTNAVANSAITSAFDTVNTTLSGKANSSDVYTTGNTYSKTEVDTALSGKADTSTTYTKSEVYNKTEIDSMIGTIETALSNI